MTTATKSPNKSVNHITQQPSYEPRTDSIYVALPGERYTPFSLGKKDGQERCRADWFHG